MEIVVGKTAGFCYGVRNAVEKTEQVIEKAKELYCLGELVHNDQVIKKLEKKGLKIIKKIEESKGKTIIRTHGIAKDVYQKAKQQEIEIVDLTCPNVLKIHEIAKEYQKQNYFIFLLGEKSHAEVIGTASFCGDYSSIIELSEQIEEAINQFKQSKKQKVLIIAQTTFHTGKFKEITNKMQEKMANENIPIEIKNTICNATQIRQEETRKLAKNVDCMIIIGGKKSSNTKKLYEIAEKECKNTIMIETKEELSSQDWKQFERIGIMAGASTPKESIDEVVEIIKEK